MYLHSLIHSVLFVPYGTISSTCACQLTLILCSALCFLSRELSPPTLPSLCASRSAGVWLSCPSPVALLAMYPSGLHVFTHLCEINFASVLQGIEWTAIEYFNNAIICELIEKVGAGSQKDQVIFSQRKRMRQLKTFLYVFKHTKMQNNRESTSSMVTFFWPDFSKTKLVIIL